MNRSACVTAAVLVLSGLWARSEIVVRTKDGKVHRVPVDANQVVSIEFIPGSSGQDSTPSLPGSIEGEWTSNINVEYKIQQHGNSFDWYAEKLHEKATGTINERDVSASWSGDWGKNSTTGKIVAFDSTGKASRIEWVNGVVFTRRK